MHKDTKIGLATGILILGIAGAFCFRKADSTPPTPLALKNEQAINGQLARKSRRPYLDDDSLPVRVVADRETGWSLSDEDVSYSGDVPAPNPIISYSDSVKKNRPSVTGIAASNKTEKNNQPVAPRKLPTNNEQLSVKTVSSQDAERKQPAVSTTGFHEVKSGETLSGISLKYFGTVKYYHKIYVANKDLLSSPNALIPGMKIRIPSKDKLGSSNERSTEIQKPRPSKETTADVIATKDNAKEKPTTQKQSADANNADSKTEVATKSDEKKKLFQPAKKGPFFSGPRTASSIQDAPGENEAKK